MEEGTCVCMPRMCPSHTQSVAGKMTLTWNITHELRLKTIADHHSEIMTNCAKFISTIIVFVM